MQSKRGKDISFFLQIKTNILYEAKLIDPMIIFTDNKKKFKYMTCLIYQSQLNNFGIFDNLRNCLDQIKEILKQSFFLFKNKK